MVRYDWIVETKDRKVRAAAYCRTSVLLRQNPQLQLTNITEYVKSRTSMVLVGEYIDEITGTSTKRIALDNLLADIRRGKIDVVVVAALDRLGRNAAHLLKLAELFREHDVGLISLREAIDLHSPSGKAFFTIMSAISELDRNQISERIKMALAAKKLIAQNTGSAWRCGRPSIITAENTQNVIELRRQQLSIRQIAKKMGIAKSSVQRILGASKKDVPEKVAKSDE